MEDQEVQSERAMNSGSVVDFNIWQMQTNSSTGKCEWCDWQQLKPLNAGRQSVGFWLVDNLIRPTVDFFLHRLRQCRMRVNMVPNRPKDATCSAVACCSARKTADPASSDLRHNPCRREKGSGHQTLHEEPHKETQFAEEGDLD